MIKYALVFLIGVALGSVVAVATTTFLASKSPTAAASASKSTSAESVGKSIEEAVARALKRVESEAVAARASMSAPGESDSTPSPRSKTQRRVSADLPTAAPDAGEATARDPATPLREKDADRLQELVVRSKESQAARRRDWLFLSEAAVRGALGSPDRVSPNENGTENWDYELQFTGRDNELHDAWISLEFHRGRVIDIDGAEDIPE